MLAGFAARKSEFPSLAPIWYVAPIPTGWQEGGDVLTPLAMVRFGAQAAPRPLLAWGFGDFW